MYKKTATKIRTIALSVAAICLILCALLWWQGSRIKKITDDEKISYSKQVQSNNEIISSQKGQLEQLEGTIKANAEQQTQLKNQIDEVQSKIDAITTKAKNS